MITAHHVSASFFFLRTCRNGVCFTTVSTTNAETETETEDCNTEACVCTLTAAKYREVSGREPVNPVGFREEDGVFSYKPTRTDETDVNIGDTFEDGELLTMNVKGGVGQCGVW